MLPLCSIFSNSGHVGWYTASSPDTALKLHTLVMIQTNFGFHWSSTFRGEDGRQVMAIAHMTLWVRWAKKVNIIIRIIIKPEVPRSLQSLTWIKAAFNNNATALWWPSWRESATAGHHFGRTIQWLFHQSLVLIELLVQGKMVLCEFPIGSSYVKLSSAVQPSWSEGRTAGHIFGREPSNDYFIKI